MKRIQAWLMCLALLASAAAAFGEGEAPTLEELEGLDWSFSSGAGAWSTDLRIAADGSFSGAFHDSEMGEAAEEYPDGTIYYCAFSGQLSLAGQADDGAWRVHIDSLTPDEPEGQESIDEGVRFVSTKPYGLSESDDMLLYRPGTPLDVLTEDMLIWTHAYDLEDMPEALESWFMYSEANDSGFVGFDLDEEIANPWVDLTQEQLAEVSGLSFNLPEGAENASWRWLESERLAEMNFTIDEDEYCARVQPDALEEGQLDNISGMYFDWENEEEVTVGHCPGTLGMAQTGSSDWVELCLWYDAAPGLMYALSVYTTDPDGLDLTAVAEMVYSPVQGDA